MAFINDLTYASDYIFNYLVIDKMKEVVGRSNSSSGYGVYTDDQYVDQPSAFDVLADIETVLPNNGNIKKEDQLPIDVSTFLSNNKIQGQLNDGIAVELEISIIPELTSNTYVELYLYDGVNKLFPTTYDFTKGSDTYAIAPTIKGYVDSDWASNGAEIRMMANTNLEIFDITYIVTRLHKAR